MERLPQTPEEESTLAESKRLQWERQAKIMKGNRSRNAHKRADRSRERHDDRMQLHDARRDLFFVNGITMEERQLLFAIVDQRPEHPVSTPADITGNFRSARQSLQQFIESDMFPEEIPEGVAPKVTAIRSTALSKWKNLRTRTAGVDRPAHQKIHGLQDTDRDQLMLKRRSARDHKRRERIRRLRERTNGIRQLVRGLSIAISADPDLRAARDVR